MKDKSGGRSDLGQWSEVGGRRSEVGGRRAEGGGRRSEGGGRIRLRQGYDGQGAGELSGEMLKKGAKRGWRGLA